MPINESSTKTSPTRIVILGGGFGGVYTFKRLHKIYHNDPSVELILINDTNYFLFTPLLHEVATGSVNPEHIIEPLRQVLGCCLSKFYEGAVTKVDVNQKRIHTTHDVIDYDYLVMSLGSKTQYFNIPDAEQYAFPLKTIDHALKLKSHMISHMDQATKLTNKKERQRLLRVVIVGGGPTGVELAAETAELFFDTFDNFYKDGVLQDMEIVLVQRDEELIPMFSKQIRDKALRVLKDKGVRIHLNTAVERVAKDHVILSTGEKVETNTVVWVAGVQPHTIDIHDSVAQTNRGCYVTNEYMQLPSHPDVYVIGDMAHCVLSDWSGPLPALAQVAVAQGKCVAENIAATRENKPLIPLNYKSSGMLISLGQWMAAGQIKNIHFSGKFAWWLWRTIYVSKLISWRKKIKVVGDWTVNLFGPRDISKY